MLVCRNFSPRSVIVAVVLLASSNSCFVIESTSPSTANKPTCTCFPICLVSIDMFVDFDMSIYIYYILYYISIILYILFYREREIRIYIYIHHVCVHTPLFVIISPMLLVISHLFWICEAAGRQAHQEWSHPRRFQIQVVVPLFCWLKMFENNWNTFHFRNSQWIVSKPSFEMNCANVHRTSATVDGIPTPNLSICWIVGSPKPMNPSWYWDILSTVIKLHLNPHPANTWNMKVGYRIDGIPIPSSQLGIVFLAPGRTPASAHEALLLARWPSFVAAEVPVVSVGHLSTSMVKWDHIYIHPRKL